MKNKFKQPIDLDDILPAGHKVIQKGMVGRKDLDIGIDKKSSKYKDEENNS